MFGILRRGAAGGGRGSDPDVAEALRIRNERNFADLLKFTEDRLQSRPAAAALRRHYAHALIELGQISKAISILASLVEDSRADPLEHSQAIGLLGRAYKQIFLDHQADIDRQFVRTSLQNSLRCYGIGLKIAQTPEDYIWHGVNVAALAKRSAQLGIDVVPRIDWRATARSVEETIIGLEKANKSSPWNCINAGEACLALDESARAVEWFNKYAKGSNAAEYALHSLVRQLQFVWGLEADNTPVGKVLAMLQARLYGVENGPINVASVNIGAIPKPNDQNRADLERVIGAGGFEIYESFYTGLGQRGPAIALISSPVSATKGTGFLVDGKLFNESWAGQKLLLTNAHVVTNDQSLPRHESALLAQEAVAEFTKGAPNVRYGVELLWTSSVSDLDATLLRLVGPQPAIEPCLLSDVIPALNRNGRQPQVYIIGHPEGGPLSISLNNNQLVDYDEPTAERAQSAGRVRLRYQTPSEPGSSGSPVFYGPKWQVIGIHHAYNKFYLPLRGEGPRYEANEAIWIQSIIRQTQALTVVKP